MQRIWTRGLTWLVAVCGVLMVATDADARCRRRGRCCGGGGCYTTSCSGGSCGYSNAGGTTGGAPAGYGGATQSPPVTGAGQAATQNPPMPPAP